MAGAVAAGAEEEMIGYRFFSFLHAVLWLALLALSFASVAFATFQISTLYLPFLSAKYTGQLESHRFPDYFYKVWGDDVKELTTEHYAYLFAALFTSGLSFCFVIPSLPFSSPMAAAKEKGKAE